MRVRSPALAAFMVKEFRHILRDRQTLLILLLLPLAQVVVFGFALRTDVHDIRIAFVDPSPSISVVTPCVTLLTTRLSPVRKAPREWL